MCPIHKLCLTKNECNSMILYFKSVYFHLWFLCKSDLYIFASETTKELSELNTFKSDTGFQSTLLNPFLNGESRKRVSKYVTVRFLLTSYFICFIKGGTETVMT